MKGISFVTDENNNKIAVQIDLKRYSELWEDIYDALIASSRKKEKKISLEKVKEMLKAENKL